MGSCFKAMRKKKNSYTLDHPTFEAGDSFGEGKQPSLQSWSSIEKVKNADKVSNKQENKPVDDKIDISTAENQQNDSDHEQVDSRNGTIDVKGGKIKWSKSKKKDKKKKKGKKTDDSSSDDKDGSDKQTPSCSSSDEDVSRKEHANGEVREDDTKLHSVPVIQIDTVSTRSSASENAGVEATEENENLNTEETEDMSVMSPATWDSEINIGDGATTTSETVIVSEDKNVVEVDTTETHPTETDIRTEEITEVQVVEHTEPDTPELESQNLQNDQTDTPEQSQNLQNDQTDTPEQSQNLYNEQTDTAEQSQNLRDEQKDTQEESQNVHNEQTEFQSVVVVDVNGDDDLPRDVELASMEDEDPHVDLTTYTPVKVTTVQISD